MTADGTLNMSVLDALYIQDANAIDVEPKNPISVVEIIVDIIAREFDIPSCLRRICNCAKRKRIDTRL